MRRPGRARRRAGRARSGDTPHDAVQRHCTACPPRSSRCSARPASARRRSPSRSRELLRERGETPVAVSADALQVYAGLETLTGVASAGRARGAGSPPALVPAARRDVQRRRSTPSSHTPRSTGCSPRAARRSSSAAPGCTCAPRSPTSTCARRRPRARASAGWPSCTRTVRRRCTRGSPSARRGRPRGSTRSDRRRIVRALELLDAGRAASRREGPSQLWSEELRHPTLLAALTMQREALYARDRRARR